MSKSIIAMSSYEVRKDAYQLLCEIKAAAEAAIHYMDECNADSAQDMVLLIKRTADNYADKLEV